MIELYQFMEKSIICSINNRHGDFAGFVSCLENFGNTKKIRKELERKAKLLNCKLYGEIFRTSVNIRYKNNDKK